MLNFKVLKAKNFLLRELNYSDTEELFLISSQIAIKYYIPGLYTNSIEDVNHIFTLGNLDNSLLLGIENSNKKIIGIIYAYINNNYDFAKITYLLDPAEKGKGIMTEALKLFINYLYNYKIVNNVVFDVKVNNTASIHIMKKLNIPYSTDEDYLKFHLSLTEELPF